VVLIPGLPLVQLLLLTSAINGVLLPIELFFIMRLINDRELMGANVNGPVFNFIAWATTIVVSLLSALLLVIAIVLPLFGITLGS
jgi:Mn2+/Fe2+ NRAMP family transporter